MPVNSYPAQPRKNNNHGDKKSFSSDLCVRVDADINAREIPAQPRKNNSDGEGFGKKWRRTYSQLKNRSRKLMMSDSGMRYLALLGEILMASLPLRRNTNASECAK